MEGAHNSGGTGGAYHAILAILLLIVVGLVAAELVQHKKRLPGFLRVLTYTYSEFVLLGLLIGHGGLGLVGPDLLRAFEPFLHLGLGGVGLIFGLQFNFAHLRRFSPAMYWFTFFQAAFTFGLCCPVLFIAAILLGFPLGEAALVAAILATIATDSAPQVIAHVIQDQQARGENAHLLQFITSLDTAFAITVLALLVGARGDYGVTALPAVNAVVSLLLSLGVGVISGSVFHWLIEARTSVEEMVLYLLGLVTLNSGVAATLHLSPLFVNVVFGVTVANLSLRVEEVFRQMGQLERPLFIVLLLLAGARWEVTGLFVIPLASAYIVVRFLGKWLGCRTAGRYIHLYFQPVDRIGMGLVSQGGMALAILFNFALVETLGAMPIIETVVIVSIVLSELLAPPLVRHVLARGGKWREAA